MDTQNDNQIDRLLRRQGRVGRAVPAAGNGDGTGSVHLDADELNAFASNELPTAARMRYAGHLADCHDCRRIVTDLAVAANPSLAQGAAAVTAAPASSALQKLGQKLAWFIKPPTLRYAAPIMAVLCVAVIMGLVLRTRYGNQILTEQGAPKRVSTDSQPEATNPAPPAGSNGPNGTVAPKPPSISGSPVPLPGGAPIANPDGSASPEVAKEKKPVQTEAGKTPSILPTGTFPSSPPPPGKDADGPASQPQTTAEEKPVASTDQVQVAQAPNTQGLNDGSNQVQKQEDGRAANTTLANQDQRRAPFPADSKKGGGNSSSGGSLVTGNVRSKVAEPAAGRPADRESNRKANNNVTVDGTNNNDESDTNGTGAGAGGSERDRGAANAPVRSVSGRQFRRQGNVWVDTGYTAGYATTNVTRGSEQYRALVADEPGLRAIATQLSGEVIVVWKGRIYRIR